MLYRAAYRAGLSKEEGDLVRKLRSRGFAVAIFRKSIEDRMVKAGRETINQIRSDDATH